LFKENSVVLERQPIDLSRYFDRHAFKQSVLQEIDRDLKMINKMSSKGNTAKSEKITKYCCRMARVAVEVLGDATSEKHMQELLLTSPLAAAQIYEEDVDIPIDAEKQEIVAVVNVVDEINSLYAQIENI
jgi:hypothetical protein